MPADLVNQNGRVSSPDGTGDIGIPANPGTNVADLLRAAARRYPERPAVIEPSDSRTWGQLDAAADAGVAALVGLGVSPGERVVIALPTGADLALALFAVARAGLIAVPIGPPRGDAGAFADRVGAIAAISDEDDHGLPIGLNTASLRAVVAGRPGRGSAGGHRRRRGPDAAGQGPRRPCGDAVASRGAGRGRGDR